MPSSGGRGVTPGSESGLERISSLRKNLTLAAAALALAGIGALGAQACLGPPSGQGGDAVELGARLAAALAATAAAKRTPDFPSFATPTPEPPPGDNATLDLLLRALYEGVSHGESSEPDWHRLEPLFVPGARLMPPRHPGDASWKALSFDEFREAVRAGIATRRQDGKPTGFFEREIGRETNAYGDLTTVLSAYEARFRRDDEKPFLRGVNAIQIVAEGNRWAILSLAWDTEGPDNPIPERLLRADPDSLPTPAR
jgi:hypothetical protein